MQLNMKDIILENRCKDATWERFVPIGIGT